MLQRDFEADGGLTPMLEDRAPRPPPPRARRDRRGVRGARTSAADRGDEDKRGLPPPAPRRRDSYWPRDVALICEAIKARGISVIDVIKALARRGFREEAENLLWLVKLRLSGDYLQTSAVVRDGKVISAVNDPNDYGGPGTGYRLSEARRKELNAIRDVLDREEVLRTGGGVRTCRRAPGHCIQGDGSGQHRGLAARGGDRHHRRPSA